VTLPLLSLKRTLLDWPDKQPQYRNRAKVIPSPLGESKDEGEPPTRPQKSRIWPERRACLHEARLAVNEFKDHIDNDLQFLYLCDPCVLLWPMPS
jgi:hypothetical protein